MIERRKFFSTFLLGLPVAIAAPALKAPAADGPLMSGFATCSCGYHMLAEPEREGNGLLNVHYHCTNRNCPHFNVRYTSPRIPMEKV